MIRILSAVVLGLLAIGLVLGLIFGVMLGVRVVRTMDNPSIVQQPSDSNSEPVVVENPVKAPASDCEARAKEIGAPANIVSAICGATPGTNGVSLRLPVGTKVKIGTITFDAENRVWFLQDFTVPQMASYAFEYAGAEQALFDAPFVVGSELGYGANGERVPFKICFDTEGECAPPVNLFPNN